MKRLFNLPCKSFAKIAVITITTLLTLVPFSVRASGTRGSGGDIMGPIQPAVPFEYRCKITWITDIGWLVKGSSAAISQAAFTLNNKNSAINTDKLPWKHGYADSLDPLQTAANPANGKGEALAQSVAPDGVLIYFSFSGAPNISGSDKRAYVAHLTLNYSINKGPASNTNVSSEVSAPLSQTTLTLEGRAYSNGVGELQMPYTFSVACEQ